MIFANMDKVSFLLIQNYLLRKFSKKHSSKTHIKKSKVRKRVKYGK